MHDAAALGVDALESQARERFDSGFTGEENTEEAASSTATRRRCRSACVSSAKCVSPLQRRTEGWRSRKQSHLPTAAASSSWASRLKRPQGAPICCGCLTASLGTYESARELFCASSSPSPRTDLDRAGTRAPPCATRPTRRGHRRRECCGLRKQRPVASRTLFVSQ